MRLLFLKVDFDGFVGLTEDVEAGFGVGGIDAVAFEVEYPDFGIVDVGCDFLYAGG